MGSTATEIAMLDATDQAALVGDGEVSAVELLEGAIGRIERLNPSLGAVVTTLYDQARGAVAAGLPSGPFRGVPFLLKDLVVEIEGTPSITQETAFRFTDGSGRDAATAGCLATGLRALNAVPAVNDLPAGWVTALDLPLIPGAGTIR